MKILRPLLVLLALAAAGGVRAAEAPLLGFEAGAPAATHPSLYSFADVYRLTVAGEPFGGFRFMDADAQPRLVSQVSVGSVPEAVPEPRFSVSAPHDDARWALFLAGLFACAWVAHRRLASPY
jgi:hypothetical protein